MSISIKATMPSYCIVPYVSKKAYKVAFEQPCFYLGLTFWRQICTVHHIFCRSAYRVCTNHLSPSTFFEILRTTTNKIFIVPYALRSNPSNLPKSLSHSDSTDCQIQKRSATGGKTSISDMYLNRRVLT